MKHFFKMPYIAVYMTRAIIPEKESFRAIPLTLLAFIALKSWTCQLVARVESLLQIERVLNVISVTKVHLKCNYLNYVDSQYIKFSNKRWHYYNCSKDLLSFTAINNSSIYAWWQNLL